MSIDKHRRLFSFFVRNMNIIFPRSNFFAHIVVVWGRSHGGPLLTDPRRFAGIQARNSRDISASSGTRCGNPQVHCYDQSSQSAKYINLLNYNFTLHKPWLFDPHIFAENQASNFRDTLALSGTRCGNPQVHCSDSSSQNVKYIFFILKFQAAETMIIWSAYICREAGPQFQRHIWLIRHTLRKPSSPLLWPKFTECRIHKSFNK